MAIIAFDVDDCIVDLAQVNIKVARYNNGVKRMVPSFRDSEEGGSVALHGDNI
jgi:hypothetical protein